MIACDVGYFNFCMVAYPWPAELHKLTAGLEAACAPPLRSLKEDS
jgi:hypothetical protein